MRTALLVTVGLIVLGTAILASNRLGYGGAGTRRIVLGFLPLWLAVAAVNAWNGVVHAGYSVGEELPINAIVFGIPAAAAALYLFRSSR